MYCTQCGQPVGTRDRTCAACGNDLLRAGGVRLTADIPGPGQHQPAPPDEWFSASASRHGWSASGTSASPRTAGPPGPRLGGPVPPDLPPPGPQHDWTRLAKEFDAEFRHEFGLDRGTDADSAHAPSGEAAGASVDEPVTGPPRPVRPTDLDDADWPTSEQTPVRLPVGVDEAPAPPEPERPVVVQPQVRRSRLAIALLALGLAAAAVPLAVVTLQFLNPPDLDLGNKATPSGPGSAPPSTTARATTAPKATVTTPATKPATSPTPKPSVTFPANATPCNDRVAVGPNTSCEFGVNVAAAVDTTRTGTFTVTATSPVTNKSYTMTCVGGPLVTCTGGNGAVVHVKGA